MKKLYFSLMTIIFMSYSLPINSSAALRTIINSSRYRSPIIRTQRNINNEQKDMTFFDWYIIVYAGYTGLILMSTNNEVTNANKSLKKIDSKIETLMKEIKK